MAVENLGAARIVADIWRDTVRQKDERIEALEAALGEIAGIYEATPQTPTKLCAALHAVSKLAEHALRRRDQ